MFTKQETFNIVVQHLRAQKVRSTTEPQRLGGGGCLYRGPNGTKCAIGALIRDEDYSSEMEGKTPREGIVREALTKAGYAEVGMIFLRDLQIIHDTVWPHDWEVALLEFAKDNNLTMPA